MKNESVISKEDILLTVVQALQSSIGERLKSYNSPLNTIVDNVVFENKDKIQEICREALSSVVSSKEFKNSVKQEFTHKVAKSLVGKLEGSVEKAVEVLRQDQTIKARMILAIESIINENIK